MENKYFTPDIEDIHVGYECEILNNKEKWNKINMPSIFIPKCVNKVTERNGWLETNKLRVSYLTKEQIEAEGWEYVKNTNKVDVGICHIFDKNNYMLGWFPLINKIALLVRDPSKAFDKNGILVEYNNTERYTGSCKDINTFRKICKLLEI
jgi:hypothetical protein